MSFLKTKYQRIATLASVLMVAVVLVLMTILGLPYKDSPEEYGVLLVLGMTAVGQGDILPSQEQNSQEVTEEVSEESVPESTTTPTTQNTSSALQQPLVEQPPVMKSQAADTPPVAVKKKKTQKRSEDKKVVKNKPQKPRDKKMEKAEPPKNTLEVKPKSKPKKKPKPKPSKATQNVLSNLLAPSKGRGKNQQAGVIGKPNGQINGRSATGATGSGGNSNYRLSGRKVLQRPVVKPNCNEQGRICVRIYVDSKGKVIKATPGVKGSTSTAKCLMEAARKSALKTRWNADRAAPLQQGLIIYDFVLAQ